MKTILIAATSIDGFITRHDETGSGFTSPEDKRYFNQTVQNFDCLIFGRRNYELSKNWIDNRLSPGQLKIVMTRNPKNHQTETAPENLEFTKKSPQKLLEELQSRQIRRICILGGGEIYSLFLESDLVDEIWLTVEPLLFGKGVKLLSSATDRRLELLSSEKLNRSTLLLRYRPG